VGTGVIAPINPYIRLITGIENMIGIFYLAVVVSRLVSTARETGSSVINPRTSRSNDGLRIPSVYPLYASTRFS
jgi:hypothetical protein